MLIQFVVGNYRSFRKEAVLSMVAVPSYKEHKEHVIDVGSDSPREMSLLKSCICYGANASGKSNLIKSFLFLKDLVINSSVESRSDSMIPAVPFAFSTDTVKEPTVMEISFILKSTIFRYGFEASPSKILKEWLYEATSKREAMLFEREEQNIVLGNRFKKEGKGLPSKTRENALFLSVAANFNSEKAKTISNWFRNANATIGSFGWDSQEFTLNMLEAFPDKKEEFLKYLKVADLGIEDFSVVRKEFDYEEGKLVPAEARKFFSALFNNNENPNLKIRANHVKTVHKLYDSDQIESGLAHLDLYADESAGTRRFFCMLGPLQDTLSKGKILFIDELDASFHNMMTEFVVSLFNNPKTNPNNAQLIFTTHNTNLLDPKFFRRDQVWFTQKDRFGETELFSLAEFKPRNDDLFQKKYLSGRYGAIPTIGYLEKLSNELNEE